MNDESWEQLQQQLANVLADTFHGHDGSVVNRWVVLADVMDQQGERSLFLQCSPDMKSWDTLGMLEFARQTEQTASIAEMRDE